MPHWGNRSFCPYWWPTNIAFVSPKNNRSATRPRVQHLDKIIKAFVSCKSANIQISWGDDEGTESPDDVDMEVDEKELVSSIIPVN